MNRFQVKVWVSPSVITEKSASAIRMVTDLPNNLRVRRSVSQRTYPHKIKETAKYSATHHSIEKNLKYMNVPEIQSIPSTLSMLIHNLDFQ